MTPIQTPPSPPRDEGKDAIYTDRLGLDRLIFFSDAVFAIAITLLALEIRLPPGLGELSNEELRQQLVAIWPSYLGFAISFLVIGSFWMGHFRQFRCMTRYDNRLLFLNLCSLMAVAFIPFPTAVLSEYGDRTATIFYALAVAVVGVLKAVVGWYAERRDLIAPQTSAWERRQIIVRPLIITGVFLASIPVAFLNPTAAMLFWLLLLPALRWAR